ncbi:MAG: DUF998 domain-containing protein [Dermatophilaceae bacterium]
MSSPAPASRPQADTTIAGRAVVSSLLAPVSLVVGWLYAVSLVPEFDLVRQPVSDLTASEAPNRWVMTAVLVLVGGCHVVTALGLRPADPTGRWLLGVGGAALVVLALVPNHSVGHYYLVHTYWTMLSFALLACWPALSARFGRDVAWPLRMPVALTSSLITVALLLATVHGIITEADTLGLREGALLGWTTVWPLVVVLGARSRARRPGIPGSW